MGRNHGQDRLHASLAPVICGVVAVTTLAMACSPNSTGSAVQIAYEPLDAGTFVSEPVIDGWVNGGTSPDQAAIHAHAWNLWQALTATTDQSVNGTALPVWETWYDGADLFLDATASAAVGSRDLDRPNQFGHAGDDSAGDPAASILTFNRFNRQMLDHVAQNRYFDAATISALRADLDRSGVPVADRSIAQFPNTSVMLKPVFWILPGDRPASMPYWAGGEEGATTDPTNPDWKTWTRCVVVDPTGSAAPDEARTCNAGQAGETDMSAGDYEILDLGVGGLDLYAFELTEDEVAGLGEFPLLLDNSNVKDQLEEVEAGDFAVLVAMHVTTRETANWTWQTYWWVPDPTVDSALPPGSTSAPEAIAAPWDRFRMCAAYFMVTPPGDPDGEPHVCFNPYLETNLTGLFSVDRTVTDEVGVHSNCMSCHLAAQAGPTKAEYVVHGLMSRDDAAWFADDVRTEFAWSLAMRAHEPPFTGPGENVSASDDGP